MADSIVKTAERLAILETQHENTIDELRELKNIYQRDMDEIKECLRNIEVQTSTWKNIFWGITMTLTFMFTVVQWLFHVFGIDIKSLFLPIARS